MSFPRYPKYKPSGVEWLGEVPEHWEVWKLAHAFTTIGSGTTPKSDVREYYDDGEILWLNTGDLCDGELESCEKRVTALALKEHPSLKIYPIGSVVMAMYGATIGKLGMLCFPATVNQACCVFGGPSEIEPKFMFYWFLGFRAQVVSLATGGGQPNISQEILRGLRLACPPAPEQTRIAEFLDRETAKIDGLVAEQRRLMELLKEKRQAVISHAVTRGLNPNAPLKPSGIEWLGDIPAHWTVAHLNRLVQPRRRITYGIVQPGERDENGRYMVRGQDYSFGWAAPDTIFKVSAAVEIPYKRARLITGDLVITIVGAGVGNIAIVPDWLDGANLTQTTARIAIDSTKADAQFIAAVLQSPIGRRSVEFYAKGAAQPGLNIEHVRIFPVTIPPLDEQREIAAHIGRETAQFDALTAEAQRAIDLLQERRTALISAAVTGQIDVRHLQAPEN